MLLMRGVIRESLQEYCNLKAAGVVMLSALGRATQMETGGEDTSSQSSQLSPVVPLSPPIQPMHAIALSAPINQTGFHPILDPTGQSGYMGHQGFGSGTGYKTSRQWRGRRPGQGYRGRSYQGDSAPRWHGPTPWAAGARCYLPPFQSQSAPVRQPIVPSLMQVDLGRKREGDATAVQDVPPPKRENRQVTPLRGLSDVQALAKRLDHVETLMMESRLPKP